MVPEAASGVPHELVRLRYPGRRVARLSGALVAGALAGLLAGCASMPTMPGERRDEQLAALEARVLELSQKAAVQEVELARLRQQVAALEARSPGRATSRSSTSPSAPPAVVSSAAPATPPRSSVTPPRATAPSSRSTGSAGPVEESELPLEEPVAPPVAAPPASPREATAPRAPLGPEPSPSTLAGAAPGARAANEGEAVAREAQAVYDEAYTFYHQGKFPQAEARFEEFLAQSPRSELSDNAQYWIGAARFSRGDFRGALAAFRRTVELYPNANKVPDALYKMGQALEELSEPGQALAIYEELVERFPDTAAATLAEERRSKLRP